jgi:hypothetical protein
VVAGSRTRPVCRGGTFNRVDHVLPVQHPARIINHIANMVEPGLVCQHLFYGDTFFSRLGEFRPVGGDALVIVNQAPVGENVQQGRANPLGGGITGRHGVLQPGVALPIALSTPQVHHTLAPMVYGHGRTPGRASQDLPQNGLNITETGRAVALYGNKETVASVQGRCGSYHGALVFLWIPPAPGKGRGDNSMIRTPKKPSSLFFLLLPGGLIHLLP